MTNSKVIFVTGATGFVGRNLMTYLGKRNLSLNKLDRDKLGAPKIVFPEGITSIIHLAGKAHDLKKSFNFDEYLNVNYQLTKKLYDAFLESDAKKFIFVSSVKASADSINGILTEEDIPNPQTDYGKSKLMAEQYIQQQPLPVGKHYCILRPCMIHGPGNKGNLNLLYKFVNRGIPYPLAAFENKRSFLSVENLCFVLNELIENDVPSCVYNIADDEALSTNEVVGILATSNGKRTRLWKISSGLIKGLAKMGDIFKLPLNTERLTKLTENYVISNEKIKNELGIQLPLTAIEGLKRTAYHFKNTKNENRTAS